MRPNMKFIYVSYVSYTRVVKVNSYSTFSIACVLTETHYIKPGVEFSTCIIVSVLRKF